MADSDRARLHAQSGGSTFTLADGTKKSSAAAEVQIGTLRVRIADLHDLPAQDYLVLGGGPATRATFLGHPAMTYSDHTAALHFDLGGGTATTGTGGIARHLVVGRDGTADGGSYELTIRLPGGARRRPAITESHRPAEPLPPGHMMCATRADQALVG
ncbi:hypothetical protein [Kitasatospora sp. A2-31]|uniref:hypothetical protein n=1 Tax=Kitasatospora sp. A2-31 TaxID=2916414 RepID=UPI001EECB354|nr:hypothetical protein [Kitasatospora sp. A2-31]MCG6498203.1 hypothetical protein [Kitasatospora sp. A2-31]